MQQTKPAFRWYHDNYTDTVHRRCHSPNALPWVPHSQKNQPALEQVPIEIACYLEAVSPPLYLMTHEAAGEAKGVVVLVPPFAEEKKAAQRSLVEMARALAAAGLQVLRFDLRGTGDSGGEFGQADMEMWREDLRAVLVHGRWLAGDKPLHLIGLRFGATLAWMAADDGAKVDSLALWEPITSGATYMRQNRQRSQIRREITDTAGREGVASSAAPSGNGAQEAYPAFDFDGFAISSRLHREMVATDLLTAPLPACRRLLVLQISGSCRIKKPLEDLRACAVQGGIETELDNVAVEAFWSAIGLVDTALVRERTLAWLGVQPATGESAPTPEPARRPVAPVAVAYNPRVLAEPLTFMSGEQRVHGVLYRPEASIKRVVLLLHGWSGYRIGPGHLLTEAARALAGAGYAASSFDFRGRGESEWSVTQASLNSMIRDATRAVPVVLERTGATRVTLLGLCSGSEVALAAGLADPRIDSLALWSAPIFSGQFTAARQARRSQANARKYLQKLFYPETWAKLFTGRLNYKMIGRALSGGRSNEDAGVQDKAPDTASLMREFEAFPGRLLFIYATNDPETEPSRNFYREFVERTHMPHEFYEVQGANHNYYSLAWKQEIIDRTISWLSECVN